MNTKYNMKRFAAKLAAVYLIDRRKILKALRGWDIKELEFWETATQFYRPRAINRYGQCVSFSFNFGVRVGDAHDIPTVTTASAVACFGTLWDRDYSAPLIRLDNRFVQALLAAHRDGLLIDHTCAPIVDAVWSTGDYAASRSLAAVYANKSGRLASTRRM